MKANTRVHRPSQLRIGLGLTKYVLKATLRNKAGYFFSLLFPLIFVAVFGLFGSARQSIRLGVPDGMDRNNPVYQAVEARAAAGDSPLELVHGSEADLEARLRQGRIAGILEPAAGTPGSVTLVVPQGSGVGETPAESYLRALLDEMSLRAAGVARPAFQLSRREAPGRAPRHFDFILPGQIGFSMLSLATFGIAYNLSTLKKTLVLKRMFASAVRPITFVVALGLSRSVQAVVQTAVILALGVIAFRFPLARGLWTAGEMLLLSFFGILSFFGFGILMTNLADDDHSLPVVLNLFNLPQVLLAGVFFPIDGMPAWLQLVGNNLPLAYLNTSLRKAALEGAGLLSLWPYLAGMLAWSLVAYVLAAKTFKTE